VFRKATISFLSFFFLMLISCEKPEIYTPHQPVRETQKIEIQDNAGIRDGLESEEQEPDTEESN
jgi:hypothetical protein